MSLRERIRSITEDERGPTPFVQTYYQLFTWVRAQIDAYLRLEQFDDEASKFVTEIFPDVKEQEIESFLRRDWPAITIGHFTLCGYNDAYGNYICSNLQTYRIRKSYIKEEVNANESTRES